MSTATVYNTTTGCVHVQETGRTGPAGLVWIDAGWVDETRYQRNQALEHDGTSYRALSEHIASPETEPGTGADWRAVWQVVALGSDVADVSTVAGIADEIVAVAGVRDEVEAVAGIADEVQVVAARDADVAIVAARDADIGTVAARDADIGTVAAIDAEVGQVAAIDTDVQAVASVADDVQTLAPAVGDVQTAAANIAAIQAAPQAADDAADARDQAQAYATGTEPGGPGTKSAREYATEAANSATAAQNATLIGYGVSIYNEDGIEAGGYYSERRANAPSVQTHIFAEIINGDPGSEVSIVVTVGGVGAYGPFAVEQGAPVVLDGLAINISATDDVSYMVTPSAGVRELFIKTYGAVV